MLRLLSSTLSVTTVAAFETSKEVLQSTLENLLSNDLAALIGHPSSDALPGRVVPTWASDAVTRINLDERIHNALCWFRAHLFAPAPAQLLPFRQLLEPLYDAATQRVTTPAYLVLHALLRSYLGFTQPHYHDFLSSVLAREELINSKSYPESFANQVAALIEFQNTVRTVLLSEERRELGVWTGSDFKMDDAGVLPVLKREILAHWQGQAVPAEATIILAHLAVALSYENRWSEHGTDSVRWQQQLAQAQRLFNDFAGIAPTTKGTLCIFEFASYVFGDGYLSKYAQNALGPLFAGQSTLPERVWISFGRFWSTAETERLRQWIEQGRVVQLALYKHAQLECLRPSAAAVATGFGYFDLTANERFELLFARQPPGYTERPSVWELLSEAFAWFSGHRHLGEQPLAGLPVAAVGYVLHLLQVIYPELFCHLRISQVHARLPAETLTHRTLSIPVVYPTPAELEQLALPPARWLDPKLVVARYLAAELLNQRLAYGAGSLNVEVQSGTTDELTAAVIITGWLHASEWVEKHNHQLALQRYLEQAASPREALAEDLVRDLGGTLPKLTEQPWALCVDIGSTVVKGGIYPLTTVAGIDRIAEQPQVTFSYPVAPNQGEFAGNKRYAGGQQFAQRLHDQLITACEALIEQGGLTAAEAFRPIAFIGLSWPGPVAGERGREYVAATSRILDKFTSLTDEIAGNSLLQLHALRIREQVAEVFCACQRFGNLAQPQQMPLVVLLNDGEAHSLGSLAQFEQSDLPAGRALVLTASSGTALGVLHEAKPLPVLADAGKFVVDLAVPFAPAGDLPAGVGNRLFSADTFVELASQVIAEFDERRARDSLPGPSAKEMLPIQAIELGIYCGHLLNEPDVAIEKYAEEWFGSYAEAQLKNPILPPEGQQDALAILEKRQQRLINALRFYESPNSATLAKVAKQLSEDYLFDGFHRFVLEVTFRTGCLLADLIATAESLFDATTVLATGGPMAGALGRLVRAFARNELVEGYGYRVVEQFAGRRDRQRLLRLRGIYFPEPRPSVGTSAAWGAGMAALGLYQQKRQALEWLRLEEWLYACPPRTRIKVSRTTTTVDVIRVSTETRHIDVALAGVAAHLHAHKARLGLFPVPGSDDEFVKTANPDPHVLL